LLSPHSALLSISQPLSVSLYRSLFLSRSLSLTARYLVQALSL
jgi:hypothetical protein